MKVIRSALQVVGIALLAMLAICLMAVGGLYTIFNGVGIYGVLFPAGATLYWVAIRLDD